MGPNGSDDWHPTPPNMAFVYVIVPLYFPSADDSEARYWIYFYIDSSGNLNGYVYTWGYWLRSGNLDFAEIVLETFIPNTIPAINDLV